MEGSNLLCYSTLALILIIIPATVIWLAIRRSGASLVNIVPLKVRQFKRKNPDLQIITAGATKARKMKSDRKPRYGLGWAVARRSVLFLSEDGLHCGNWFLPLHTISEATLIKAPVGYILKVSTSDDHFYQFGLKRNPSWEEQSVLPIHVEHSDLVLSLSSIIFRSAIIGYFLWIVVKDFAQQSYSFITFLDIGLIIYFSLPIIRVIKSKFMQQERKH
jgi:hypothetical protein